MRRDDLERLLERKQRLEERAAADLELSGPLKKLRIWQAQRLERSYAPLRRQARFAAALDFFLNDLYGAHDFSRRDADLKRALAQLKRALPAKMLEVLCMALELQVLTLELDEQMASVLEGRLVDAASYTAAYRALGRAEERRHQIELIVRIGKDLDQIVRQRWMGIALRVAHVPAQLAGFGELQGFLERGFEAFRRMGDAADLLAIIMRLELRIMDALLRGECSALERTAVDADAP